MVYVAFLFRSEHIPGFMAQSLVNKMVNQGGVKKSSCSGQVPDHAMLRPRTLQEMTRYR